MHHILSMLEDWTCFGGLVVVDLFRFIYIADSTIT